MATDAATIDRRLCRAGFTVLLIGVALLASGCDHDELPNSVRQTIEMKDLPANVKEAAEKALPGVTLQDAWKNVDRQTRALHSYEIRGRASNGKVREVRVSTEGAILELE